MVHICDVCAEISHMALAELAGSVNRS